MRAVSSLQSPVSSRQLSVTGLVLLATGYLVLLATATHAQTEILRPTADADGGANFALGCVGQNLTSSPMPLAYDAAGQSTSSWQSTTGRSTARFQTRIFSTWAPSNHTYNALSLNLASSSDGYIAMDSNGGQACAAYSTDAGNTWSSLICDDSGNGWTLQTTTATLSASQNLNRLLVAVCTQGNKEVQGTTCRPPLNCDDDIIVYDIWTSGTYSVPANSGGSARGAPHRAVAQPN